MSRIAAYPNLIESGMDTTPEWKESTTIFRSDAQQFEKKIEEVIEHFLEIIRDLEFSYDVDVESPVVITMPTLETTWVRAKVNDLGPAPFHAVIDDYMILADETDF